MKNILLIGAGLSATSLIKYLLAHTESHDWHLVIAERDAEIARKKIAGNKNATAIHFDVHDEELSLKLISEADVVISFLPAMFHTVVATQCVKLKKHMVTASYVSPAMKALDAEAREAGVALLNELGVDPGIDHMSAMKIMDEIHEKGGELELFKSSTGGLVAPEYDNNPWNYKFTWNPRNVVLAGQGVSQFIRNGRYKYVPYNKLFTRTETTSVLNVGEFEVYPNRDSLSYRETYNLQNIPTIYRGTMRRPGYCEAWNVFVQLGVTDDSYSIENSENMTYRQFVNTFLRYSETESVEEKLAKYCQIDANGEIMQKLIWLGIFEEKNIGLKNATPAQIMQKLLEEKWSLEPQDKDMIVMQHKFIYNLNNKRHQITSSMVVFGETQEETAMSITVGTPVAIAVKLLLTGKINLTGVHTPVIKELYEPILEELKDYKIEFIEESEEL